MAKRSISGVRLSGRTVEWVTLRDSAAGGETVAAGKATSELEPAAWEDPAQRAAEIRRLCPALAEGHLAVGLASAHQLMRVADLPTADPAELDSMVRLQLDKLSPFPEERAVYAYEVLRSAAGASRVLMVATQREALEGWGTIAQALQAEVVRIDSEALAWWWLLVDRRAVAETGRHLIVLLEPAGGLLWVAQDGLPIAVKAVGGPGDLEAAAYAAELTDEVGAWWLSLDLEWGAHPLSRVDCWRREVPTEALCARLQAEYGLSVGEETLDDLMSPALGLARRECGRALSVRKGRAGGTSHAPATIDLVPAEWRERGTAARRLRLLKRVMAVALGVWALGMATILGGYYGQQHRVQRLEARMAVLQPEVDRQRQFEKQVRAFEQHLDRRYAALECLREASRLLPADVNLTAFQFKKGKHTTVRGEALAPDPIYNLKQALDQSALFSAVEITGSVQPSKRKDTTVYTFQMNAHLPGETP